ncbi:MAG: hypothetical protein ACXVKN_16475 [Acidimicrobiia bacterium]
MQTTRRALILVTALVAGLLGTIATAPSVSAATITSPTGNPFVVPGNAAGQPLAFTVSATGYTAGDQVFIEQCDGVATTATGWDPTVNCDLGTSPAAAVANASGVVTFSATDPNHAFKPFKGFSPQGLFNCLGPSDPSPNNGATDYRNCKLRVSTNNSAGTSDQVFLNLQLPNTVGAAPSFSGTPSGATVGQAYSFAFTGITGSPAPTFTMSPATVAGGITVTTGGTLHGTPTTAGSFPITVTAANGVLPNAVRALTLVVAPATVPTILDCGFSGSLGLKPSLSNIPPKRPKATKVKGVASVGTAAGGTCVDHSVAPGSTKFPITAGSVKIKGALPAGSNCSTLATLPLAGTTFKIKWQGINPKNGKLSTAAPKTLATASGVTASGPGTYVLTAPVTSGLFAGRTVKMTLRTDMTHAARLAQCQSVGVAAIGFTGVAGSSGIAIV